MPDLPAPVANKRGMPGLPAPVAGGGILDLPGPMVGGLPAPVAGGGMPDLPAPVAVVGLPVPSGREKLADLPGPIQTLDLAPLPESTAANMLKPVDAGGIHDLLSPVPGDIPSNLVKPIASNALHDLPAPISPMGDSLDLGNPLGGNLELGSLGEPMGGGLDLGSPGGLDLGAPGGLDLGASGGLDLGSEPLGGGLDLGGGGLDLGGPGLPDADMGMGLALPETSAPESSSDGIVTFGSSKKKPKESKARRFSKKDNDDDAVLDLDTTPMDGPQIQQRVARTAPDGDRVEIVRDAKNAKRQKISAAALGLIVVGAGGFFGYQWLQGNKEKTQVSEKKSGNALKYMATDEIGHWEQAIEEASTMIRFDPSNSEAYAISAQAHYAAIFDQGTNLDAHYKKANAAINKMRTLGGASAQIALAEGLHAIATRQYSVAIEQLTKGIQGNPQSAIAHTFMGWAQAEKRQHLKAIAAFDRALKLAPSSIIAHFGKANALLAIGDDEKASEAYLKVTTLYRDKFKKDHLGAIVGIAQLAEVENFGDREKRYLEILAREDLGKQNQRAVSRVWSLAGDEARNANRLSVATERYDSAIKANGDNLDAVVGLAAISYSKNNQDDAKAKLDRVLALLPGDIKASLLLAEVQIAMNNTDAATDLLLALFDTKPKIEDKAILSKMELLQGHLLSVDPENSEEAISAYKQALALSTDGGVEANLALAKQYNLLGRAEEAIATLAPLRDDADKNPSLAIQLGLAYLAAKNGEEAIPFFRMALKERPDDIESHYQLGRALALAEKKNAAITELKKAYKISKQREDIGLELADMYRQLERNEDAKDLYQSILDASNPSQNARAKAGAFYARVGDTAKANAIGEKLLTVDPNDPTGHFLKGEALMAKGDAVGARDEYRLSTRENGTPQYFAALGHAYRKLGDLSLAIEAYKTSIDGDSNYMDPRMGMAQVRLDRKEYKQVALELEIPLKVDPDNPEVHLYMGMSKFFLRKNKEAIVYFERSQALNSKLAEVPFYIGKAYDSMGEAKNAAKFYDRATQIASAEGQLDEKWVTECYRLLGYAIRESGGSKSGQLKAFESYVARVRIDDALTKEVREILIPLRAGR